MKHFIYCVITRDNRVLTMDAIIRRDWLTDEQVEEHVLSVFPGEECVSYGLFDSPDVLKYVLAGGKK